MIIMPQGIGIIRWNNQLGPFLEVSFPETITLTPQQVTNLYTSQSMGDIATPRVTSLSTEEITIISYFGGLQDPSLLVLFLQKFEYPGDYKNTVIDAFMNMPKDPKALKSWMITVLDEINSAHPKKVHDTKFQKQLSAIIQNIHDCQITIIHPEFHFETGIIYPQLEGIIKEKDLEINHLLEYLSNLGFFVKEVQDCLPSCPDCNSAKLQLKWGCSICHSTSLEKSLIMEHYICGTKTISTKFLTSSGLICPKCNLPLKTEGIDYSNLGFFYYCHKCKNYSNTLSKFLLCHNCGSKVPEEHANLTLMIGYKVNKEKFIIFFEKPDSHLLET